MSCIKLHANTNNVIQSTLLQGATHIQDPIVAPPSIQCKTRMDSDENVSFSSTSGFNFDYWLKKVCNTQPLDCNVSS